MEVLIDNRQSRHAISLETVRKRAKAILNALDCPDGELSVVLVDDAGIIDLNKRYLNRQGPTNVIAFPMQEGDYADITPNLLGDVVISLDTCLQEAEAAQMPAGMRFDQLLIHGILHLFGYDHEHDPEEAARMDKKSETLMRIFQQQKMDEDLIWLD